MRNFGNIKEALDFASANQHRLKFPFACRCNGCDVHVLSPELARTVGHERPSLVATRTPSAGLELGYIVTVRDLRDILRSLAPNGSPYSVTVYGDSALLEPGVPGEATEFSFPIVKRVPGLPQDAGTFVLLKAPPHARGWREFWPPLETRLLHSSIKPGA